MIILCIVVALGWGAYPATAAETCPKSNPWVKIDSDDLSSYPVDGAVEYCFKFGSPNSQGCTGGLSDTWPPPGIEKPCGLSHWSYRLGEVDRTATPTETYTPTHTPTATGTPTDPAKTPKPTPQNTPRPRRTVTSLLPLTGAGGFQMYQVGNVIMFALAITALVVGFRGWRNDG